MGITERIKTMPHHKKRTYNSENRDAQAAETKRRILSIAKDFFQNEGFEAVTIDQIAAAAEVSSPTIYAVFKSKRGILRAVMDESLPSEQFETLVRTAYAAPSASALLAVTAQIARQIYDAERGQMDLFRGAAVVAPEFKELEKEREARRYTRLQKTITLIIKEKWLGSGLTESKARAIIWALTGRDLYRMLVVEQGWTSDDYEQWLAQLLVKALI